MSDQHVDSRGDCEADANPYTSPEEPEEPEQYPTHVLKDIKAGEGSVQLLISTKDNVYDAENIEAGANSWQIIGSWEESSLSELTKLLSTRASATAINSSATTKFGTKYGGGKKLGTVGKLSEETDT